MIKTVIIFGKSAAGKDTLAKELGAFPNSHRVVCYTTRPKRDKEIDGVDYHFVTKEEYMSRDDMETLVYIEDRDWYYGVGGDCFRNDKVNILVIGPEGIKKIRKETMSIDLSPTYIYVECSAKERLIRSLNREENPDVDEVLRRYAADNADFESYFKEFPTGHITFYSEKYGGNVFDWMFSDEYLNMVDEYQKALDEKLFSEKSNLTYDMMIKTAEIIYRNEQFVKMMFERFTPMELVGQN